MVHFKRAASLFVTPSSDSKEPGFHYPQYIYLFTQNCNTQL